jgi:hypothetical protein
MPAGKNETKKAVPVVIYTATHRIEGLYHASDNGGRLLDDLNEQARDFIPLTDARVTKLAAGEGQLTVAKFLAVNRQTIMLFFPNPKVVSEGAQAGQPPSGAASAAGGPRLLRSANVPG